MEETKPSGVDREKKPVLVEMIKDSEKKKKLLKVFIKIISNRNGWF